MPQLVEIARDIEKPGRHGNFLYKKRQSVFAVLCRLYNHRWTSLNLWKD